MKGKDTDLVIDFEDMVRDASGVMDAELSDDEIRDIALRIGQSKYMGKVLDGIWNEAGTMIKELKGDKQ